MISQSTVWSDQPVTEDMDGAACAPQLAAQARFQALVDGVARRDATAMQGFFQEFAPLVNRLVWRLLGADRDHDDVVQQAFLNLFEAAGSVRLARALPAWVACVTVNTVRRELRRRKLLRMFFPPAASPPGPAVPGADAERKVFLERCFVLLERLGTEERIVFSLRFIEGYTLEEVAGLCGCSLATAKRRLLRARQKFSELAARDPALGDRLGEGGGS